MNLINRFLQIKNRQQQNRQQHFFQHGFFLVFRCFSTAFVPCLVLTVALVSTTVHANFEQELAKLEELILSGGRGDFHEKGLAGVDYQEIEYFTEKYGAFVAEIQPKNNLSPMQKSYLTAMALRELAIMKVLLHDKTANFDSFCQEFEPIYDDWKRNFNIWEEDNRGKESQLNSDWYSDVYRLNADMRISYGRCKTGVAWAVLMTGSVRYYKKAIKINPKNMRAHFSLGTYYFNAPAIGGGSLEKAIEQFKIVIVNGTHQERVPAHVFLAYVEMRRGSKARAIIELEKARKIAPNAPFLLVGQSLIDQGKYLAQ